MIIAALVIDAVVEDVSVQSELQLVAGVIVY